MLKYIFIFEYVSTVVVDIVRWLFYTNSFLFIIIARAASKEKVSLGICEKTDSGRPVHPYTLVTPSTEKPKWL